jgi:hypothetical protein
MEHLNQLEGFSAGDWTYEQVIYAWDPEEDNSEVDYYLYLHERYRSEDGGIELEVQPDGGWCVYVRWGVDGNSQAFGSLEEAVEFWHTIN